jgi:hypothetical protein
MNPMLKMAMPLLAKMLPKQVEKLEKFLLEKWAEKLDKDKPEGVLQLIILKTPEDEFLAVFSDTVYNKESLKFEVNTIGPAINLKELLMSALTEENIKNVDFE